MNQNEELEMLRAYIQQHSHPLEFANFRREWIEQHNAVVPIVEAEPTLVEEPVVEETPVIIETVEAQTDIAPVEEELVKKPVKKKKTAEE